MAARRWSCSSNENRSGPHRFPVTRAQRYALDVQGDHFLHVQFLYGSLRKRRVHRRHQTTTPTSGSGAWPRSGGYSLPLDRRLTISACSSWMGDGKNCSGTSSDEWPCLHEHRRQEMQSRGCVRRRRGATRWVTSEAWCKPLPSTMILLGLYKSNPSALWQNMFSSSRTFLNRPIHTIFSLVPTLTGFSSSWRDPLQQYHCSIHITWSVQGHRLQEEE